MKSTKTKKLLGGVAIAAVSLGCLGLAGVANAADTTDSSGTTSSTSISAAYQLGPLTGAMSGQQTITVNVSKAQGETLSSHSLEYIKIGDYMTHGSSGSFTVSASNQDVENALYDFITASTGGLKQAFPSASYTSADGEAFNWLLTQNSNGTFLGADASGQAGYGSSENTDYAVRLLANYLYTQQKNLGGTLTQVKLTPTTSSDGYQEGTFTVDSPGIYLIIDTANSNASLPIILPTEPTSSYTAPGNMKDYLTNSIALKDQDPQAMPVKQFVTGTTTDSKTGDLTGGTLTGSMTSSVGQAGTVTYQISNVFPNTNGYQSYTYKFIDNPGTGMTLNIAKGANIYVAGIPLSTLVGDGDASVSLTTATSGNTAGTTNTYSTTAELADMPTLVGGTDAQMMVSLNEAGMQYIEANGYQTSNVNGKTINFGKLSSQASVSNTVNGTTNTMAGANNGSSSYTGQTQTAGSGENDNMTTDKTTGQTFPQAQGELFGLTYQAFLNSSVATTTSSTGALTEADNTAMTDNNGTQSTQTSNVPLTTSGGYNGGTHDESGTTGSTTQTSPGDITGTDNNGSTDGVPNISAVGAGINWMKIWGSGSVASGAEFQVQNSDGQYLYATGNGWAWGNKSQAETFSATTLYNGTGTTTVNQAADGGLFEINGLANGTYTVTETHAATGADQNVLPSFTVTVTADAPEEIHTSSASDNLVDNTPNGTPFNSTTFRTVENVKSLTGLPLTGGAGILTGVIAAVILFGTAGIVLVVYKRRKQQKD